MNHRYSAIAVIGAAALGWACSSSDGSTGSGSGGTSATGGGAHAGTANAAGGGSHAGEGNALGGGSNVGGATQSGGGASNTGGAAPSGGASMGGAATTGGAAQGGSSPGIASCPAVPAGVPANAVTAINEVNTLRVAMGLACATIVPDLDKSAQAHCDYWAGNTGNTACETQATAHNEVSGCTGFTGADPGARIKAAGYSGNGWAEVMAFNDDPTKADGQWINSVYHRTELLSPWWSDMGYGNAAKCDVIDIGPGAGNKVASTTTAFYPYAGQTGVPRSFNGAEEGPTPPIPMSTMKWPSGLPITLYIRGATTVSHTIEVQGSGMPLAHTWLDYNQSNNGKDSLFMYTDAPFTAMTIYHVNIAVTVGGTPQTFDWTFTTGS